MLSRIGPFVGLLIAATVALSAAPAQAAPFVGQRATWLNTMVAHGNVDPPRGVIVAVASGCPTAGPAFPDPPRACADLSGGRLYLSSRDRFVAMHETGHFFDARNLNDRERAVLQPLLGSRKGPWTWTAADAQRSWGAAPPSELFADAYATCALRLDPRSRWVLGYGYDPSYATFVRVCGLIRQFG